MFSFFKKKKQQEEPERHYDPLNISVIDIRKGFVLDYDLKTWRAEEEYEYDWGNEFFTFEFKLVAPDDVCYLYVEENSDDADPSCIIYRKITFSKLDPAIEQAIVKDGKPPRTIDLNGMKFFRDSEQPGFFREIDDPGESVEFVSWTYLDESEKYVLDIEQWGDEDFDAALGTRIAASQLSNILPG